LWFGTSAPDAVAAGGRTRAGVGGRHLGRRLRTRCGWASRGFARGGVRGCTLVTPNADEARLFSGVDHPAEQGRQLCADWDAWSVAVTIGGRGAVLTEASDPPRSTH